MAFLAVHANVQPSEFRGMDPADTRALAREVDDIVQEQVELQVELAKLIATGRAG